LLKKRLAFLATCVLAAGFLAPAEVSAGDPVTCDYKAGTHTAEIVISEGVLSFGIYVLGGKIKVGGDDCTPEALVTEVDKVNITQTADSDVGLTLDFSEPFAPGYTDEEGNSDEIEFIVNLGNDPEDSLTIESEFDNPLNARAGRFTFFGITRTVVNANADETEHIDYDVSMSGVEELRFTGSDEPDVIGAQGGAGTGAPVTRGVSVNTADSGDDITGGLGPDDLDGGARNVCFDCVGTDTIKGLAGKDLITGAFDSDHLRGGKGKDTILGLKGHDNLYGQAGNDKVKGHRGQDFIKGGPGDDNLNGGPNPDNCQGGPGKDTLKNCD
jgi:Ca2+-binding RTX toxin-like protein